MSNIVWWVGAFLTYPKPKTNADFQAFEKKSAAARYGIANPAEMLAMQQKNVEFMIAATVRLEDRTHTMLLATLGLAGLVAASLNWSATDQHTAQHYSLALLVLGAAWLIKMRFCFSKPLYPRWDQWPNATGDFAEAHVTENRARVASLVAMQHEIIQCGLSYQLNAVTCTLLASTIILLVDLVCLSI